MITLTYGSSVIVHTVLLATTTIYRARINRMASPLIAS
ncbi:unnamed protein product [Brugia timori]|uniref:7TM_GPCR_Srx domain-containing protein n=1 Tax=Brugia timori TaxID=42155 RepID=A0A0R3R9Q4_9BILA|nr:unnamed protein product [Brugia timori]